MKISGDDNKTEKKIDLDILRRVESLSDQVNRMMSTGTKNRLSEISTHVYTFGANWSYCSE